MQYGETFDAAAERREIVNRMRYKRSNLEPIDLHRCIISGKRVFPGFETEPLNSLLACLPDCDGIMHTSIRRMSLWTNLDPRILCPSLPIPWKTFEDPHFSFCSSAPERGKHGWKGPRKSLATLMHSFSVFARANTKTLIRASWIYYTPSPSALIIFHTSKFCNSSRDRSSQIDSSPALSILREQATRDLPINSLRNLYLHSAIRTRSRWRSSPTTATLITPGRKFQLRIGGNTVLGTINPRTSLRSIHYRDM
jgi:hypothetical protein